MSAHPSRVRAVNQVGDEVGGGDIEVGQEVHEVVALDVAAQVVEMPPFSRVAAAQGLRVQRGRAVVGAARRQGACEADGAGAKTLPAPKHMALVIELEEVSRVEIECNTLVAARGR